MTSQLDPVVASASPDVEPSTQDATHAAATSKSKLTIEQALRSQSRHRGHIVEISYQLRSGLVQAKEWPNELLPFKFDGIRIHRDEGDRRPVLHDPCDFKLSQIAATVGQGAGGTAEAGEQAEDPPSANSLLEADDRRVSQRYQATSVRLKHRATQAPIGGKGGSAPRETSFDPLGDDARSSFSSIAITPSTIGSLGAWSFPAAAPSSLPSPAA